MTARSEYRERLAELRIDVRSMGLLAVERFEQAVEALQTGDRALARDVIEGDHELNELYLELEGECVELIALQQPVASDLRLIASSFKVLTDLERIGDLATNLAQYALDAEDGFDAGAGRDGEGELGDGDGVGARNGRGTDGAPDVVDVEPLAAHASEMVRDALDAYSTDDADACRAVADRDDELDDQCRRASATVVRNVVAADPSTATGAEIEATLADVSTALLTIRDVERVGDHAVNVAARTHYQVENDDELLY